MDSLEKIEWKNLAVSVPAEWLDFFQSRANKLGISRNAAIGLALRLGSPMLDAHVNLMEDFVKTNCAKIADQQEMFSEILAPTVDVFSVIDKAREIRNRKAGRKPGSKAGK